MHIIEQFSQGKTGDDGLNEDKIVITNDFIAVFDGATSRKGHTLNDMAVGRFAAHTLAQAITRLPADIAGKAAIKSLTATLKEQSATTAKAEGRALDTVGAWPAAAAVIYSKARKEIWRVADPTFALDGVASYFSFPQEENWARLRQSYIKARLCKGDSIDHLRENDPTWDVLTPIISELKIFANCDNDHASPYAYGVLNGFDVPEKFVEIHDTSKASEIILASDGYPEIFPTLEETEKALQNVILQDPLMYNLHPQVKGVRVHNVSFDDRTYVRFKI